MCDRFESMISVFGVVLGDRLQQPHVVVDVVEDAEAEHDVAGELELRNQVEHVAEQELVAPALHLVKLHVLVRLRYEVGLVLDADDACRAVL